MILSPFFNYLPVLQMSFQKLHFIEHKFLNYMQFIISPTVIGSGIDSMKLKPISNLKNAIRTKNTINRLGKEIIVTLDFNS